MRCRRIPTTLLTRVHAALIVVVLTAAAADAKENILYAFTGGADGGFPQAGLTPDSSGNFYGTTLEGGSGFGVVFELSPKKGGGWTETVLYAFAGGEDGSSPEGTLIFDSAGNLYGTTAGGGKHDAGTVFELSPAGGGGWSKTILHNFNVSDGAIPSAGLVFDTAGNLYGATFSGGKPLDLGVIFQLSPSPDGRWKEKILLQFGHHKDGGGPAGTLILDKAGNLYGTASGGYEVSGSVFELTPMANGHWKETVLHGFQGKGDGGFPHGALTLDSKGNVYGTTSSGGRIDEIGPCAFGCGTVFELSPGANGKWKETVLYKFKGGEDGDGPVAGVSFDSSGNLHGTTQMGGGTGCDFQFGCGTVFELRSGGGKWHESVVHRFKSRKGGRHPLSELIVDSRGDVYGTASDNGVGNGGLVFAITP